MYERHTFDICIENCNQCRIRMFMEIRDLKIFLAVAETGSITKAAGLLERSQPSVSRTIQDLEADLGFALLRRVGRGIMLSDEGLVFEEEARQILNAVSGVAARTKSIAAGKSQPIELVSTAAIGTGLLPAALEGFNPPAGITEIRIGQFLPNIVAQEISAGRADCGYSSLPLDVPGLRVLRLYSAHIVVALPADDPHVNSDCVPLSAFDGRRLITMLNPDRFQRRIARAMEAQDIKPGPFIRTNVSYSALQLVQRVGLPAIIDPITAYGVALPGVVIRPIEASVPFYWGALTATGRRLNPATLELIDRVETTAQKLIPDLEILDPSNAKKLLELPKPAPKN